MADQMKHIVSALNAPPFNRNYNLISFDALAPNRLLQELSDVLAYVNGDATPIDVRLETPDQTALRILNLLRILKYKPPSDPDELVAWREGIVEGSKQSIYPVLEMLLARLDELKERAYLARYLVHIDVPGEYQEPEVIELMNECDALMQTFKSVHQQVTAIRSDSLLSEDIRSDLKAMEVEKEQLNRRIDRVMRKIENIPNRQKYIDAASLYRAQHERQSALLIQKQEQRNSLLHVEQRVQRMQTALRELHTVGESIKPSDLMQQLREQIEIDSYLANEQLPKEIDAKRSIVHDLSRVASQPAIDQSDIAELQQRIETTNNDIVKLVDERDRKDEVGDDDKLSIYRHQAATVQRKKATIAERLQESRRELEQLQQQVQTKRTEMRDHQGNEVITSVQFKQYVNRLRIKTATYKKRRAELEDLRAEHGVAARTDEILRLQWETLKADIEQNGGVVLNETDEERPNRPKTAKSDSRDVQQLKTMINELNMSLEERKTRLNPMLNQLMQLRERHQISSDDHMAKKKQYDTVAASLESGYSRLQEEVKSMRERVASNQWISFRGEIEQQIMQTYLDRIEADAQQSNDDNKFVRILQDRIERSEVDGEQLQNAQKSIQGDSAFAMRQMTLWRDLFRLLELKNVNAKAQLATVATIVARPKTAVRIEPLFNDARGEYRPLTSSANNKTVLGSIPTQPQQQQQSRPPTRSRPKTAAAAAPNPTATATATESNVTKSSNNQQQNKKRPKTAAPETDEQRRIREQILAAERSFSKVGLL